MKREAHKRSELKNLETELNVWTEERERILRTLILHAKPEDRIRYQAQIDFLSIVKINVSKILREVKQ